MDLQNVQLLTELKYNSSQTKLAVIQRRENELRQELRRLSSLVQKTRALPPEQKQMRAIGADIIWLRWVGQSQEHLNIELAQVLAQKEALIAQHRRAFGDMTVSQNLVEAELKEQVKKRRSKSLETAIDSAFY